MAGILPTVRSGASALTPLNRTITYNNSIVVFESGQEQRFLDRGPMDTFVLTYKAISRSDRDILDNFIATQAGSFDSTWTFPLSRTGVTNGNFSQGLKGWSNSAQTNFLVTTNYGYSRDKNSPAAVIINKPITIGPSTTVNFTFQSPTFPFLSGQKMTVDFWSNVINSNTFPSGITPAVTIGFSILNSAFSSLGNLSVLTINGLHGWQESTATSVINPYSTSVNGAVYFIVSLTNTTASPINLPLNCVAFCFSDLRVIDLNPAPGIYVGCAFEDDAFAWTMNSEFQNAYDTSIRFRQTKIGGQGPTGTSGDFPGLGPNNTLVSGYPYVMTRNYYTARTDFGSGPRTAYTFTNQNGFPVNGLKTWNLSLSTLTDEDLGRLEQHFLYNVGSWRTFGFTEPDTNVRYPKVRYDMSGLSITHQYKGLSGTSVTLKQCI